MTLTALITLLASVAEQGFVALAALMAAVRERVPDPRRQLQELGGAYVRFALAHPSHLRLMFGPEIRDKSTHPSLEAAARRAFDLLVESIAEGQRAGHVRRGDPQELAVSAWALVHGLSALLIDGQLRSACATAARRRRWPRASRSCWRPASPECDPRRGTCFSSAW